jgi:hypothetical protein
VRVAFFINGRSRASCATRHLHVLCNEGEDLPVSKRECCENQQQYWRQNVAATGKISLLWETSVDINNDNNDEAQ